MSDQFPDMLSMLGAARAGEQVGDALAVPARPEPVGPNGEPSPWMSEEYRSWGEADPRGVPLIVAESHDDVVAFEDADGVQFVVPRNWVKFDVEGHTGANLVPHSVIDAPPGELERIWQEAARRDYVEGRNAMRERGEIPPDSKDADPSEVFSQLDSWNDLIQGQTTAGRRLSGAPIVPPPAPAAESGWRPKVGKPAPPTIRRKEGIPPEAGSGLGNWDEEWDEKRQRWVKMR